MTQTSHRSIVSNPAVLSGRWRLDGTSIAVGEIRLDFAAWAGNPARYRYPGISAAEQAAVLAFDFPAVREPNMSVVYSGLVIACSCGEDTSVTALQILEPVLCVCGRIWRVRIMLEPMRSDGQPAGEMMEMTQASGATP